jgi:hypothetical protein
MAYAQRFRESQRIAFPLLVDEERITYRIAGMRRGTLGQLVSPRVVATGLRAVIRGSVQGRPGNDPLLLGGTHVILPGGAVPFAWINDDYADNAPARAILDALTGVE